MVNRDKQMKPVAMTITNPQKETSQVRDQTLNPPCSQILYATNRAWRIRCERRKQETQVSFH